MREHERIKRPEVCSGRFIDLLRRNILFGEHFCCHDFRCHGAMIEEILLCPHRLLFS